MTHFNPRNPDFNKILHQYEGLLLRNKKQAIKSEDIKVIYPRSPNLIKDILIKGCNWKLQSMESSLVVDQDVRPANTYKTPVWSNLNTRNI